MSSWQHAQSAARRWGDTPEDYVLIEAFGDHAEVTVRRTGISVVFYDHE